MDNLPANPSPQPVILRDYELLELLGRGGMGAVYKAVHTRLDRVVAIKLLPAVRMHDPQSLARFDREMKAVGKLDHPHIVRATDAGEVHGTRYLVMEFVEGLDVSRVARYFAPLSIADACEIIRQAAEGLQHVHEAELVHRDMKPSNLILTDAGQVKILDLGLALLRERSALDDLTQSGQVVGTLDYMAPEQCTSRQVDIRSDIYSLGATLYRLLSGEAPFADNSTPWEKMQALTNNPERPIDELRDDVPEELAAIVHRALSKDPQERFATPAELASALRPFAAGHNLRMLMRVCRERQSLAGEDEPGEVPTLESLGLSTEAATLTYAAPTPPRGRSRTWLAVSLLIVLLAAAGLGAGYFLGGFGPLAEDDSVPRPTETPGEVFAYQGHSDAVSAVALSADGSLLLSGGFDTKLILWDVHRGTKLKELRGHTTRVRVVAMSRDGTRAVSGGYAEPVRYWNLKTGDKIGDFDGHDQWVGGVAISPDGKRMASVGFDTMLRVWDLEAGQLLHEFQVQVSWARGVAFSPDGQRVITCGNDGSAELWELESRTLLQRFDDHDAPVRAVEFSGNGSFAVTGCFDHNMRTWSVDTGRMVRVFRGHTGAVPGVSFTYDGRHLVSGGRDGTVRVWDSSTGNLLHTFLCHGLPVNDVVPSPDGRYAFSAGEDGAVRLWRLPLQGDREVPDFLRRAAQ